MSVISEVSQSQRLPFSSLWLYLFLISWLYSNYICFLSCSELLQKTWLQTPSSTSPHHQEPSREDEPDICSCNFIDTLPAGLQSQSLVKSWMWETRNWKTTVSKLGIVVNCALWTIGDSLELSNWYFHLAQFWYSDKEVISWTARWNRTSSAKSLAWYVLWDLS